MASATRKQETENSIIEIKLTRTVNDKTAYLDGYLLKSGREIYEIYEVKITGKKSGKSIWASGKPGGFAFFSTAISGKLPAGAFARIGDSYISKTVYDICMAMIAELDAASIKSEEQIAIETTEAQIKVTCDNWQESPEEKSRRRLMREMEHANSDY